MDYWRGVMDWPLSEGWKCITCKSDYALIWGMAHATCRCSKCHTQYRMRDENSKIVIIPICQLKPEYYEPARKLHQELQKPISEITKEEWENELNEKKVLKEL